MELATVFLIFTAFNPIAVCAKKLVLTPSNPIQEYFMGDAASKATKLCDTTAILVINLEGASIGKSAFNAPSAKKRDNLLSLKVSSLFVFGNSLTSEAFIGSSPSPCDLDWMSVSVNCGLSKSLAMVLPILFFEKEFRFGGMFFEPFVLPFAGYQSAAFTAATPAPCFPFATHFAAFHRERIA